MLFFIHLGVEKHNRLKYNRFMKIGIFGGAFDPPHNEHINICLAAINELGLDRVVLIPSGIQPHKTSIVSTNYRYHMIKAATKPFRKLYVDDIEIQHPRIAYAAEILPLLQIKYNDFIYIVGGDSFLSMRSWYRPDLILPSYPIAVVARCGNRNEIKREIDYVKDLYNADNIILMNYLTKDISSTDIRARLELNMNVNGLISDKVLEIINANSFYSNYRHLIDKLKSMVTERTYKHTERTVLKAMQLNLNFNLLYEKVFIASLLHDCAKDISLLEKYRKYIPDDVIDTPVMHAFLGAVIAEKEFNIEDREILNAIKYHTTGRAKMSQLEMLIFVADMLEDGRVYPGINELRYLIQDNYVLGFLSSVEKLYKYLTDKKTKIYPLTEECYNYYIKRSYNDN